MSDTATTARDWTYDGDDQAGQPQIVDEYGALIAIATHSCVRPRAELMSHARLIAAAPDLAAALEGAVRWIGSLDDWSGADDPDLDTWQAALAKARGEG
ncbi:hypothetical protein CKO31_24140 [Thiohalocapsa halophila]|uniref:Uncharacterized protein n=1 Tax=Thiohalocapsa halophila TaxID=69359 RepID=A0ABS1CPB7_9GAMM|nr:hypothetical protein [Thiohalocapsa halophila]MBK1633772.1 hypothetical protein [Thiohalocapsa halophila]